MVALTFVVCFLIGLWPQKGREHDPEVRVVILNSVWTSFESILIVFESLFRPGLGPGQARAGPGRARPGPGWILARPTGGAFGRGRKLSGPPILGNIFFRK